jgi:hypothetical protein
MSTMPKAFPKEFRDDVVAIAMRREASFAQIAKDFGIGQVPGSGVTADPSLYALSAMKVSATTSLSVSGRTRMRERARTSSPR